MSTSWSEVDLTTVPTDTDLLPEGKYEFELLPGARYSKWDPDKIEAAGKTVGGEFPGRVKYFSYGDPKKVGDWIRGVFVRLQRAMGVEMEPGEDPVAYLNREDVVGGHFTAKVYHRMWDKDGESQTKDDIKIGSIMPVRV